MSCLTLVGVGDGVYLLQFFFGGGGDSVGGKSPDANSTYY